MDRSGKDQLLISYRSGIGYGKSKERSETGQRERAGIELGMIWERAGLEQESKKRSG